MAFSKKTRQEAITKIQNEEMDLLVIGGGITGAGLTLQAAAAGMKVAVLERISQKGHPHAQQNSCMVASVTSKTSMSKSFPIQFQNALLFKALRHIFLSQIRCYFLSTMMKARQRLICFL